MAGSIALKDYWEAGSIVFLFTIAEWLESRAGSKVGTGHISITHFDDNTKAKLGDDVIVFG